MYNPYTRCPYRYMAPADTLYNNEADPRPYPSYEEAYNNRYARTKDYGPDPFALNIEKATKVNDAFRSTLWTGENLQLTLMSLHVGEDIGLEIHHDHDQFIRIEEGQGMVQMGDREDQLDFQKQVFDDDAIFVPAGKWHNLINTGRGPLKLYSIYAPPEHPPGTLHETKAIAQSAKSYNGY